MDSAGIAFAAGTAALCVYATCAPEEAAVLVEPISNPITATWVVPGSKSMTNRGFILGALASGTTTLKGVLHSDDTR
eukprot:SAG11_NODE_24072_length_378_cov_1.301075_1_plen_76_part_01